MSRPAESIRYVPLSGLHADVLEKLASILVTKDVPAGVVALIGQIPRLWDDDLFEVDEFREPGSSVGDGTGGIPE